MYITKFSLLAQSIFLFFDIFTRCNFWCTRSFRNFCGISISSWLFRLLLLLFAALSLLFRLHSAFGVGQTFYLLLGHLADIRAFKGQTRYHSVYLSQIQTGARFCKLWIRIDPREKVLNFDDKQSEGFFEDDFKLASFHSCREHFVHFLQIWQYLNHICVDRHHLPCSYFGIKCSLCWPLTFQKLGPVSLEYFHELILYAHHVRLEFFSDFSRFSL